MSAGAVQVAELGGPAVSRLLTVVEERMWQLAAEGGELLAGHAVSTIAAGGKRLRPLLVCLSAGVPPPENDQVVRAAVAVELVHGATLVHDDVLDGSALRRGRPTVYAAGGRMAATAAGDLLFSRAFAELAMGGSREAVQVLSRATYGLAQGELLQRQDAFDTSVSVERYLERCRLKTAILFWAACALGALAVEGPVHELGAFGERIGLAFQILDDVLDVTGPPDRTGKPRGADLLDGTVTLPLIYAQERHEQLRGLDLRALQTPDDAEVICESIARTDALSRARARALELAQSAKRSLPVLGTSQQRALELIADGVVERSS